jgi:hypothetical protein
MNYFLTGSVENYTELCTIEVDLSQFPLSPRLRSSGQGIIYRVEYDVVLLFGLTELKAMLAWKENVRPVLVSCIHFY